MFSQIQSTRQDYERAVDDFLAGPFRKAHIDELVERWSMQIRPYVSESAGQNGSLSVAKWETGVNELREIIESARAHRGFDYETAEQL